MGEATMTKATVKERPILFSGDMVKAILAGRKTQTRRVVKPQPIGILDQWSMATEPGTVWMDGKVPVRVVESRGRNKRAAGELTMRAMACPYGEVGGRLWVRETFYVAEVYSHGAWPSGDPIEYPGVPRGPVHYDADGPPANTPNRHYPKGLREGSGKYAAPDPYAIWIKRPTIHMPRWASRIALEIMGVRVERLQDMSPGDAIEEGIDLPVPAGCEAKPNFPDGFDRWDKKCKDAWFEGAARAVYFARCADAKNHVDEYQKLWERINGTGSWALNPWVWVVEFKRIDPR